MPKQLSTVEDLIKHLAQFDLERPFIIDNDGDTHVIDELDIQLWNVDDEESPVALFF
jgi:hypothetical protein